MDLLYLTKPGGHCSGFPGTCNFQCFQICSTKIINTMKWYQLSDFQRYLTVLLYWSDWSEGENSLGKTLKFEIAFTIRILT